MRYVDLSVAINKHTPIYPGDPPIEITKAGDYNNDGYSDHLISIGSHVGTHIDAPIHMIPNGKAVDAYPVDKFVGNGVCIDVSSGYSLDTIRQAEISRGDIVLLFTGMGNKYTSDDYFTSYDAIPNDIAKYLLDARVSIVGMDMASPDYKPFNIHKLFLQNDVLIIENLTNLHQLIGKEFTVYAFPLRLRIDGSPVRVVAELQS